MPLRPAQTFNLVVVSIALALTAECALLWKLGQRPVPAPPAAPVLAAPTPAVPLFTVPGIEPLPAPVQIPKSGPTTQIPVPRAPRAAQLSPDVRSQAKTYFDAATAALSKGDKKTALEEFRRVVSVAPDHLPTRLNLALLYMEANAPALAIPHLQKAVQLDPKSPAPRFQLARALVSLQRPQEAIAPLRDVVRLAPTEREPRVLLSQIYLAQKRPLDAYAQWAAVAQINGRDVEANLQAAGLADALKRPHDAEKWLRRAQKGAPRDPRPPLLLGRLLLSHGNGKGAASALSSASHLAPGAFEVYPLLADARLAAGDLSGARGAIQTALKRLPKAQNPAQKAQIEALEGGLRLTLGRVLGQMKKPRDAKIEFARAVQIAPHDANALSLLATASAQSGDRAGAASALQKSLEIDPQRAGDHRFLAQLFAQDKNYRAASQQLALYTQLQPRDASAWSDWATIAARNHDSKLQLQILAKLAALDPKNPVPFLQKGVVLRDLKRPDESLASFERALKLRGPDPNILFEIARLQSEVKQLKNAAQTWQKLIAVQPDFLPAYEALLQNSAQSGNASGARLFLARSLAAHENVRALSEVLRFYEKNRRTSEAQALLSDIVRRNPRARLAKAALDSFENPTATPHLPTVPAATATPQASPTEVTPTNATLQLPDNN